MDTILEERKTSSSTESLFTIDVPSKDSPPAAILADPARSCHGIQNCPIETGCSARTAACKTEALMQEEGAPSQASVDPHPPLAPDFGEAPNKGSVLQSNFKRYRMSWCLALATIAISAFSIWYVDTVLISEAPVPPHLVLSPGKTSLAVQVVAHVIAYLVWQLFGSAVEALRWALASRDVGVTVPTFFAMSRATPMLGVLSLCSLRGSHQMWAVQKHVSNCSSVTTKFY
jgi:hypothetical protein